MSSFPFFIDSVSSKRYISISVILLGLFFSFIVPFFPSFPFGKADSLRLLLVSTYYILSVLLEAVSFYFSLSLQMSAFTGDDVCEDDVCYDDVCEDEDYEDKHIYTVDDISFYAFSLLPLLQHIIDEYDTYNDTYSDTYDDYSNPDPNTHTTHRTLPYIPHIVFIVMPSKTKYFLSSIVTIRHLQSLCIHKQQDKQQDKQQNNDNNDTKARCPTLCPLR